MSGDEVYSESFDSDDSDTETTKTTQVSTTKASAEKMDGNETVLRLFNATLVLIKRVEAYSLAHADDWHAPSNMSEMLKLVQQLCANDPVLRPYIGKEKEMSQIWAVMAGVEDTSIPCESADSSTAAAATATADPAISPTSKAQSSDAVSLPAAVSNLDPTPTSPQPKYVCVILHREADDHLLFESRGADAVNAANKLTCFGGKIEVAETPLQAILRECREELDWVPPSSALTRCVDLYVDGKLIAYFYFTKAPPADAHLKFEESRGRKGVWVPRRDVESPEVNVSPWHVCVMQAWRRGEAKAMFVTI